MRKVFQDKQLENLFQQNGYVEVPMLNADEVQYLWKQFHDTLPQSGGKIGAGENDFDIDTYVSYDFTFIDKNPEYKKKIFGIITEIFKPKYDKILADYKPIIANYIRKKTETGEVPLHQNWAFVDEMKYSSVSIWCPLVDSNRENGTLEVLPKSHKKFGKFRGPMVPWECEPLKDEIINDYLIPVNTKAGNAVILDDSIIHYSRPNTSKDLRIAIQVILIPADATSLHYHLDHQKNSNKIEVYEVDWNFYMHFHPWFKPSGVKKIGEELFMPAQLNSAQFKKQLQASRFDKRNLFQRIFN